MNTVTLPWPPSECSPNARTNRAYSEDEILFVKNNVGILSHSEIGKAINRAETSVRNKCWKLGLVDKSDYWTSAQIDMVVMAYRGVEFSKEINLDDLAARVGKHKSNVCRKARSLGLTDISRLMINPCLRKIRKPKFLTKDALSRHVSERVKRYIAENGHPRGALGMKHTDETKRIMSEKSSKWNASLTEDKKMEYAMKSAKTRHANGTLQTMNRSAASWGAAWREIGGTRKYYRSKWEANYARYLEWLKAKGEISGWEHEPETFWFDKIKRGCLSYLPDFRVTENGGAIVYHEVKGWMDDRSKTKIRRMAKYHPTVRLLVIDSKAYAAIKKVMQPIIKEWEIDSKGR